VQAIRDGSEKVELALNDPLDNFGYYWNQGYRPKVGWIRQRTGFVDRMDNGMFPEVRKIVVSQTGVDDVQQRHPYGIETEFKNSYAQAVRAAGRGVRHAIDHVVQGDKVYSIYVKTA